MIPNLLNRKTNRRHFLQHNHSNTNHKIPDYDLHMPRLLTYPLPVGIVSAMLGCLLYFLLQNQPIIAGVLIGISILSGGVYVGLFTLLKRYTNLERRLKARDKFLVRFPGREMRLYLMLDAGMVS